MRYGDDFVLLAKGENMLEGMTDIVIYIGTCCGMEKNVDKKTIPTTDHDRSKKTEECGIFQPFVLFGVTFTPEIESRISVAKA